MRKFILTLVIVIKIIIVNAQHTPKQWIIGTSAPDNCVMDFANGTLTTQLLTSGTQVDFVLTNAAIGDADSSLLYYSDGVRIYNKLHNIIANGDTLSPGISTYDCITFGHGLNANQAVVFLPAPGDTNLIYVFHEAGNYYGTPCPNLSPGYVPYSFYYSIIDKTQDSIISKNNMIFNDTIGYPILAIKHGNGRDWWIIIPDINQPVFYYFLLTPNGVSGPYMQTIGQGSCGGYWSIKFSELTNKIVGFKGEGIYPITRYLDVFDFDRCTGLMSTPQTIIINNYALGLYTGACEISPSGRFLYAGVLDELHQFDLTSTNIQASEIVVDTIDSIDYWINKFSYCFMQCAPDGKIYSSDGNYNTLSVINSPDSLGIACNPQQGAVTLPSMHNRDLPNIPLYELGPLAGSACDTLTAGMEEIEISYDVFVYPNPANDYLQIQLNSMVKKATVKIYNSLGVKLAEQKLNEIKDFKVSTSQFNNGMFFLVITNSEGESAKQKFIVQH